MMHLKKWIACLLILSFLIFPAIPGQASNPPAVSAHVAYAIDADTDQVFYEQNIDKTRSVASLTKLMTALLVFEGIDEGRFTWTTMVPISDDLRRYAYHDYSGQNFDFPEEETVMELTRLLLVGSSNCAARILAEYIGGSEAAFTAMMNQRARDLALNAYFNDASGLKANAVSARAMVDLSRHMILSYPEFLSFTRQSGGSYRGKSYQSANRLYRDHYYEGAVGLKTGWTPSAGFSFIAAAERGGHRVIAIVIGSSSYDQEFIDAKRLLDYSFAQIATKVSPETPTTPVASIQGQAFASLYNKVNLRSGPGTNFDKVGQVQEGAPFTGIEEKNGWYQLDHQGQEVWVRKDLVAPVQDSPLPAKEIYTPVLTDPERPASPDPTPVPPQEVDPGTSLLLEGESYPTADWALEDMEEAAQLGYDFTGLAGRSAFNGSQELSRAEFAALLTQVYFPNEVPANPHPFLDVHPDTWYHDYIQLAYDKGLVAGVSLDAFAPEDPLRREQVAAMIARAEDLTQDTPFGFQDEGLVSGYALPSVLGLAHAGIMVGDADGHFRPHDTISRQEGTALVLRLHHLQTA